ncbi:tRNA1(Val) (adenine(37)-N6)-methyltransferase [Caldovatus aquaticus]|uniref:Methyltransferase domain-containing protein n=1 Tax=Caldovatus aquaticus TaxID=2865671 RepID=A0ABS7F4L6_9PROT|nr:methyltransferase domain-containing protein [Caldovatus aquaticus]MBW8270571.1 methyltransferase domain-containing protein [Caldovatus aquaticus]
MRPPDAAAPSAADALLGGRVRLRQPPRGGGFRAAIDPVLLAAAVPARPGERVLEAGCGSGAAFLCLAARVSGLSIVAVERDPALAALARENAAAAGLAGQVAVVEGDVADPALARRLGPFDHAFANPPFWPAGTPPPGAARQAATHESGATLEDWARFLAAALRPRRGTASLILPAARFDAGVAALRAAGCGAVALLPFWPRAGEPAKRVLLRAVRGGRGPARVLPGLTLHEPPPGGGYTAAAQAVLRDAAPLDLG